MAAPFLPDADALRPPGAIDDPHPHLMALGFNSPDGRLSADEVVDAFVYHDGQETGGPPRWRIESADVAEWAMAKLAEARRELDATHRQRASYAERIDQWFRRSTTEAARTAAFFEAHLILWALTERSTSGGATKTAKLPSGEVRTRKPGPWKPSITDPAGLLEWAIAQRDRGRGGLVRSQLVLDVLASAVAEVAVCVAADDDTMVVVDQATGERIPGVIAKRTEPSPTVVSYELD